MARRVLDEPVRSAWTHDFSSAPTRSFWLLGVASVTVVFFEHTAARPLQPALASAATFAIGGLVPLAMILASPTGLLTIAVSIVSLACLAALGMLAARAGGAPVWIGAARVAFWGALAMAATAAAGKLFASPGLDA